MFAVKATYRNETRKFTFPEPVLFPTYEELHNQLCRIFPISCNYYLSRLIFSPDASKPGRVLVGREVHTAEEYGPRVAPLRRRWPDPLLRFTIFDQTPHKAPNMNSQRLSLYSTSTISPSVPACRLPSPVVSRHDGTLPLDSRAFVPPPSQPPTCVLPPQPPPPSRFSTTTEPCSPRVLDTVEPAPCCSISEGKVEIQALLSSFREDLERILTRTFGADYAQKPDPDAGTDVIPPQAQAVLANNNVNASSRWCFVCKINFTGVWYGCIKCPWHVVCPGCFFKSHSAHALSFGPSHIVRQRSMDCSSQASTELACEIETRNSMSGNPLSLARESSEPAGSPALPIHYGILCNNCDKTVVGIRHKCLDCPNYDLCSACVESGETERHSPFHEFFEIEIPGRVFVHTVFSGTRDRSLGNPQQLPSANHATDRPASMPTGDSLVRHCATCNLCDSAIIGERYKCVACPDFDTCSSCFRITTEQHPNHGFVKVNKPEDFVTRGSISLQVTHLAACNSCRKTIRGARYKCMHPHCPDFDLCSDCEALPIPVHPPNHPMLKLKTSETVVPTVCRAGQRNAIDTPSSQGDLDCNVSRSPVPPNTLAISVKSLERSPAVVSDQVIDVTPRDQMPLAEEFLSPLGSPTSEVLGTIPASIAIAPSHLLVDVANPPESPQSIHQSLDIYHQWWPKVNQEMIHLSAAGAQEAGDSVANSTDDAISEPVCQGSPAAQDSILERAATPSIFQASQRHETSPISPTPSTKFVINGYHTPSSTPSNDQKSHRTTQQSHAGDQQELVTTDAPRQKYLDSALLGNTNVPDGQIFPPGAEFVKGWHMMNNGELPWPTTTEVQFVAGETFAPDCIAPLRAKVGVVHPGQELDIWTRDLKAPDAPGRYIGYWRLSDGQGNFFGSSVWIDLTVADHHSDRASEQSLAASSMVMPNAHPANSVNASDRLQDPLQPSLPSTKTVTDDPVSDISSVSLVSVPTSDDEDAEWQDTRTHSEPLEYVVLYDRNSEE